MTLHGELKVNDTIIGYWQAVRQYATIGATNSYTCKVRTFTNSTHPTEIRWDGIVEHNYNDGPLMLLRRILDASLEEGLKK